MLGARGSRQGNLPVRLPNATECRVCKTGSSEEDDAFGLLGGVEGAASSARGSGASGALGLPSGEGAGLRLGAGGLGLVIVGLAGVGGLAAAGGLALAAAALSPAFCNASIRSSLAPWSWNVLARAGFIWKSTPRCCTISIILLLGELPSRSRVISSFDNGESAGAAARLIKPASTTRAIPNTIFLAKLGFDFIAGYPWLSVVPNPPETFITIDRVVPTAKSCIEGYGLPLSSRMILCIRIPIIRLARSPPILQAHLAQFAGTSLWLGNCERHRSHSAHGPFLTLFLDFGLALIGFHRFLSGRPTSTCTTIIADNPLPR